jgi:hypothetical protein
LKAIHLKQGKVKEKVHQEHLTPNLTVHQVIPAVHHHLPAVLATVVHIRKEHKCRRKTLKNHERNQLVIQVRQTDLAKDIQEQNLQLIDIKMVDQVIGIKGHGQMKDIGKDSN